MVFSLCWRPAPPPPPESDSSRDLKYVLCERLFGVFASTSLKSEPVTVSVEDKEFVAFLDGVIAATNEEAVKKDALSLRAMLEKYGKVTLWIGEGDEY